jgi:hypothetical protein
MLLNEQFSLAILDVGILALGWFCHTWGRTMRTEDRSLTRLLGEITFMLASAAGAALIFYWPHEQFMRGFMFCGCVMVNGLFAPPLKLPGNMGSKWN